MRKMPVAILAIAVGLGVTAIAWAAPKFNNAQPKDFDPGHSYMVQSGWVSGLGCPTGLTYTSVTGATRTYTNPVCSNPMDMHNDGLLMTKSSPSDHIAYAQVNLKELQGTSASYTEVGYDLRKPAPEK